MEGLDSCSTGRIPYGALLARACRLARDPGYGFHSETLSGLWGDRTTRVSGEPYSGSPLPIFEGMEGMKQNQQLLGTHICGIPKKSL